MNTVTSNNPTQDFLVNSTNRNQFLLTSDKTSKIQLYHHVDKLRKNLTLKSPQSILSLQSCFGTRAAYWLSTFPTRLCLCIWMSQPWYPTRRKGGHICIFCQLFHVSIFFILVLPTRLCFFIWMRLPWYPALGKRGTLAYLVNFFTPSMFFIMTCPIKLCWICTYLNPAKK